MTTDALTVPARPARRRAGLRTAGTLVSFALAIGACGGGSGGGAPPITPPITPVGPTATEFQNPVYDADFPDPAALRSSDGSYYAYATQTTGYRIQSARSSNLVSWTFTGEAMPAKPSWATASQNFWAPDVNEREGRYVMYFSTQIDPAKRTASTDDFCIGMATATAPTGPFVDVGQPVRCGAGATTIDPMGFDDQTGRHWLYWGSDRAPLMVQELAADRKSFVPGSSPTQVVLVRAGSTSDYDTGLIEGPWVTFKDPYYYLYFSGNNCCGTTAHYAVMVARSTSPTGPFEVLKSASGAAQPILQGSSFWIAPGHNSVIRDAAGVDWMLYHAVNVNNPYLIPGNTNISRRVLMLDRISYANGWPSVGASGVPTATPQPRPTVP